MKPTLQYGCEALLNATPGNLNKLEVIQNQALRLITGAVKSTPLASMQVLTRKNPLKFERVKIALILYEKLTCLPYNNFWSHCKYRDRNLKTQNGFMQKIVPLCEKYSPQAEPEKLLLPLYPLNCIGVDYKLDLLQELKKRDMDRSVMRLAALEAIYNVYPEEEWLHIYTDGSLTEKNGNIRVRIYCKLFSFYLSLGQHATHFDGEIEAMSTALMQLFGRIRSYEKAVIFSDSSAAIQLIAKLDALPSKRVTEIHSFIKFLQGLQKDIKFQWIPSHCGVTGNEMADYLAKNGTKISQTSTCKLTFHTEKLKIKRGIQVNLSEYYTIQSQNKSWGKIVENRNIVP
jgi:ribonuclease HI